MLVASRTRIQTPTMAVELDIGGVLFKTTLSTLRSIPDSFFERMFSGDWKNATDEQGRVFIDRDGEMFKYVMDFLRNGPNMVTPVEKEIRDKLINEARFYSLPGLEQLLDAEKNKVLPDDHWPVTKYAGHEKNMWVEFGFGWEPSDDNLSLSLQDLRRDPNSYFSSLADKIANRAKDRTIQDPYCHYFEQKGLLPLLNRGVYTFRKLPALGPVTQVHKNIMLLLKFLRLGPMVIKESDVGGDWTDLLKLAMFFNLSIAVEYIDRMRKKTQTQ